jgi:hypothetical protein
VGVGAATGPRVKNKIAENAAIIFLGDNFRYY